MATREFEHCYLWSWIMRHKNNNRFFGNSFENPEDLQCKKSLVLLKFSVNYYQFPYFRKYFPIKISVISINVRTIIFTFLYNKSISYSLGKVSWKWMFLWPYCWYVSIGDFYMLTSYHFLCYWNMFFLNFKDTRLCNRMLLQ